MIVDTNFHHSIYFQLRFDMTFCSFRLGFTDLSKQELQQKTDSRESNIILSSPERVHMVVTSIVLTTVLLLLIVPVFLLWFISTLNTSKPLIGILIALLLIFTLIFSGVLSAFTRARRHEIIAAAAA